jgi:transposase, IS5 family
MVRYQSSAQLQFFKTPFDQQLDNNNRWVQLSNQLPWDNLVKIYNNKLRSDFGAPGINARKIIGALIIKHKLRLSDREVIEMIKENMYMQYFVGLSSFTTKEIFHHTEFVHIRKRLSEADFNLMTEELMRAAGIIEKRSQQKEDNRDDEQNQNGGDHQISGEAPVEQAGDNADNAEQPLTNKGDLKLDATVADQKIKYPNDVDLLNTGRQEIDRMIDMLCMGLEVKRPRTYRRRARKQYLLFAKKKNKTFKHIRRARKEQLGYLKRNLARLDILIRVYEQQKKQLPFEHRDLRILWATRLMWDQQLEMHINNVHRIEHRIVNLYQPYVRPMLRGKAKAKVEFGSKNGVSLQNGYAFIDTLSWDAYNESSDLKKATENYKTRFGYYPECVIADAIYHTHKNKEYCTKNNIRLNGKSLSKTVLSKMTPKQRKEHKIIHNSRNQIEGKFGQAKNGYNLNRIAAKYANTSASWISAIYFVMNILAFAGSSFLAFFKATLHPLQNNHTSTNQIYNQMQIQQNPIYFSLLYVTK